jgi:hypothetical protein
MVLMERVRCGGLVPVACVAFVLAAGGCGDDDDAPAGSEGGAASAAGGDRGVAGAGSGDRAGGDGAMGGGGADGDGGPDGAREREVEASLDRLLRRAGRGDVRAACALREPVDSERARDCAKPGDDTFADIIRSSGALKEAYADAAIVDVELDGRRARATVRIGGATEIVWFARRDGGWHVAREPAARLRLGSSPGTAAGR